MTDPNLFDHYADGYDRTVQDAIGASGESVQYFVDLKTDLTSSQFDKRTVRRVLDFGCGIGNTTRSLASRFREADVTGFDTSRESIRTAETLSTEGSRVSFVSGGASSLPFEDQRFDVIFASCVFHHIEPEDRVHWARELHRVCSPGGSLIVFEHNPINPLTRHVVRTCPFDEGVVLLGPWETGRLLGEAGFDTESPQFYFFFPNILRFLRPIERALRWIPIGAQYYVVGARASAVNEAFAPTAIPALKAAR